MSQYNNSEMNDAQIDMLNLILNFLMRINLLPYLGQFYEKCCHNTLKTTKNVSIKNF